MVRRETGSFGTILETHHKNGRLESTVSVSRSETEIQKKKAISSGEKHDTKIS